MRHRRFIARAVVPCAAFALSGCTWVFGSYEVDPNAIGPVTNVVSCVIDRNDCITRGASCTPTPTEFAATACGRSTDATPADACKRVFCSAPDDVNFQRASCTVKAASMSTLPIAGVCTKTAGQSHQARVTFRTRYRTCTAGSDATLCGTLTNPLTTDPADPAASQNACLDITEYSAAGELMPSVTIPTGLGPKAVADPSVEILSLVPEDQTCPLTADKLVGQSLQRNYDLPDREIGGIVAGSSSVSLRETHGSASIGAQCDAELETCSRTLDVLDMSFADTSVAGLPLTGLKAHLVSSVPLYPFDGHLQVPPGVLKLSLHGNVNGAARILRVENVTPWLVDPTETSLHIEGGISVVASDAAGKELPVQTTVSLTAPLATPAQVTCASATPTARLFGFEDRESWSSSEAALSFVSSPSRQGCGALGVQGQGYLNVSSTQFSTAGLPVQSALSVDLYIPSNQPNPSYLGALQLYLSCPSGGVFNQYVGQSLLTGRPQDQFSTLRIPLPAATSAALRRNPNDCSFKWGLNVNPTGRTWILDNLRFTP